MPRKLDAPSSSAALRPASAPASTAASAARLRAATARLTRRLRQSATGELTLTQLSALGTLQSSGPIRLNELASREGISASTISKLIDALERHAFVERSPDAGDGRASRVAITAMGTAVLEDLRRNGARLIDRALRALDASDRVALTTAIPALERLVGWVEADDPPR